MARPAPPRPRLPQSSPWPHRPRTPQHSRTALTTDVRPAHSQGQPSAHAPRTPPSPEWPLGWAVPLSPLAPQSSRRPHRPGYACHLHTALATHPGPTSAQHTPSPRTQNTHHTPAPLAPHTHPARVPHWPHAPHIHWYAHSTQAAHTHPSHAELAASVPHGAQPPSRAPTLPPLHTPCCHLRGASAAARCHLAAARPVAASRNVRQSGGGRCEWVAVRHMVCVAHVCQCPCGTHPLRPHTVGAPMCHTPSGPHRLAPSVTVCAHPVSTHVSMHVNTRVTSPVSTPVNTHVTTPVSTNVS